MTRKGVLVTVPTDEEKLSLIREVLAGHEVFILPKDPERRREALGRADVLLSSSPGRELTEEELALAEGVRLMQLTTAGADHINFSALPRSAIVCGNVGGYAEPMAEHVLAMALALEKRLLVNHEGMKRGEWKQFEETGTLRGKTAGILGYGGIGRASARLLSCLSMEILAINRRGRGDELTSFAGTLDDLDRVLQASHLLLIALPLTAHTRGLIGRRELSLMPRDGILINVARGEIVDEAALFQHLKENPSFRAGIDAWWVEPFRHGQLRIDHPFLELPNVLGSPHNSASGEGASREALRLACLNLARFLKGEQPAGVMDPSEYSG